MHLCWNVAAKKCTTELMYKCDSDDWLSDSAVERVLKVWDDVREIISTLCSYKDVEIIAGAVCLDHVHLSVAIPPKLSVSSFMGYLKGKSTLMIYDRLNYKVNGIKHVEHEDIM